MKHILYSVFRNKCPKCKQGNVFSDSAFNLRGFDKMHTRCSCCGEKYEKEPGYFYGAMYVSYALMVAWFVITWALDSWLFHLSTAVYLLLVSLSMLALMPFTFRFSRLIWLNFFGRYDADFSGIKTK